MGMLNPLSMLGLFAATQIPADYTRVEYLRGTGTQCIDTLWTPKANYELTVDFNFLDTTDQCIYGRKAYDVEVDVDHVDNLMIYRRIMLAAYNTLNENTYRGTYPTLLGRQIITVKNKKVYRNGEEVVLCGDPSEDWSLNLSYYLFARHQNTPPVNYFSTAEIFYFYATDGITSCLLLPCLDNNKRPCMYNPISKVTHYNQGTGEFIAGPPMS